MHARMHASIAPAAASEGKTWSPPVLMQDAIYREAKYFDIDLAMSLPTDRNGTQYQKPQL